jgi:translation initiation factor 1A
MRKKKSNKPHGENSKRALVFKDIGQEYAQVTMMLGNRRVQCLCYDGKQRLCHIRGSMKKRVWISVGDIVLVALRDFQDDKGDIIHKYTTDEIRTLRKKNEIPDDTIGDDEFDVVVFDEEEDTEQLDIDNI